MLTIYAHSMLAATRLEHYRIKDMQGKGTPSKSRRRWWRQPPKSNDLSDL